MTTQLLTMTDSEPDPLTAQTPASGTAQVPTVQLPPERELPRPHISARQYALIWEHLDEKYGHRCYARGCKRQDLQVDHKDGNRQNWHLINLQPACPQHQKVRAVARTRERGRPREPSAQVPTNADTVAAPGESYEIRAHRAEKPFRSWVIGKLVMNGGGPLSADWFITNGAEVFGVMPISTTRYLEKMWSDSGPLEKVPGEQDKRSTIFVKIKAAFWDTAAREYDQGARQR